MLSIFLDISTRFRNIFFDLFLPFSSAPLAAVNFSRKEKLTEQYFPHNFQYFLIALHIFFHNLTTYFLSSFFFQSGLMNLRDVLFVGNPIYDDMPKEQARIEVNWNNYHVHFLENYFVTWFFILSFMPFFSLNFWNSNFIYFFSRQLLTIAMIWYPMKIYLHFSNIIIQVLKRLPNLAKIDGDMVKPTEREIASGIPAN